jgi:hypothetical protein
MLGRSADSTRSGEATLSRNDCDPGSVAPSVAYSIRIAKTRWRTVLSPPRPRLLPALVRTMGHPMFQRRTGAAQPCPDLHARPEYVLHVPLRQLVGADHLEVLVNEDVVWPVDADVVDLVLAVAQLHDTVDDSPRDRRPGQLPSPYWLSFR